MLNSCRALYYLVEGKFVCNVDGARWMLTRQLSDADLVEGALNFRLSVPDEQMSDVDIRRAQQLAESVRTRIENNLREVG